jgi:ketosteroid isomerase-like protein
MHENGVLIQRGFEAFAAGDMASLSDLFADDLTWFVSGDNSLSGTFTGKEEVFGYLTTLFEVTEGTYHQSIHALLADDEHVVVLTDAGWDKPKPYKGHDVIVFHVSGGKATSVWVIQADQAAATASLT